MRTSTRHLTAVLTAVGLVAGAVTATAGAAQAAGPQLPAEVYGAGINYGYYADWEDPTDTTNIVGYRANLYAASDTTHSTVLRTEAVTAGDDYYEAEFDNLAPNPSVKYVVGVATRFVGDTYSVEVYTKPDQAYKPLGKVTSLTAKARNKALTFSWKAPRTDAYTGPVQGYLVFVGGFPSFVPPSQRSLTIKNLKNGTRYTATVYAGSGDLGAAASVSGTPIGSPTKPTKLKRTWKKHGKAKLTWKKAKSTKAAPVTGYYVYVNGKKVATLGKKTTSYTAKGEKKGKKYSFSVKAKNSVGSSKSATIGKKKRPIS